MNRWAFFLLRELHLFILLTKSTSVYTSFVTTRQRTTFSFDSTNERGFFLNERYGFVCFGLFVLTKANSASSFTSQIGESTSVPILRGISSSNLSGLSLFGLTLSLRSFVYRGFRPKVYSVWKSASSTSPFHCPKTWPASVVRYRLGPKTEWAGMLKHVLLYCRGYSILPCAASFHWPAIASFWDRPIILFLR